MKLYKDNKYRKKQQIASDAFKSIISVLTLDPNKPPASDLLMSLWHGLRSQG